VVPLDGALGAVPIDPPLEVPVLGAVLGGALGAGLGAGVVVVVSALGLKGASP
jgi:hypothetical protein